MRNSSAASGGEDLRFFVRALRFGASGTGWELSKFFAHHPPHQLLDDLIDHVVPPQVELEVQTGLRLYLRAVVEVLDGCPLVGDEVSCQRRLGEGPREEDTCVSSSLRRGREGYELSSGVEMNFCQTSLSVALGILLERRRSLRWRAAG